jgi:hypothetical protein
MKTYLPAFVLLTFASVAWGGAILTVGDSSDAETVGNLVEVDVTVFGLPATLASYQFAIDFSPNVLSYATWQSGTIDNLDGTITLASSDVGLNFGGTLLRLYFNAIGPGTAFLSIPTSSVILLDASGNEIPFTGVDGRVYVDSPALYYTPVAEPNSLELLLIGMMGIAGWHQRRRCSGAPVKLEGGGLT